MSKKKLMLLSGGILAALLLAGMVGVSVVSAQEIEPDPQPPIPFNWPGGGRGFSWTMFDTVADVLGLTPEELFAKLHAGKSPSEIAEEQGVEMEDVREAIHATRQADRSPWAKYDTVAEALELTPEELFAKLHEGKSLSEVAEEQGVDIDKVHEAVRAAQVEARKEAIEQAVEDGKLTQEQADWMMEGLEKGFLPAQRRTGGQRFGRGGGMRTRPPGPGQGQGMKLGYDL